MRKIYFSFIIILIFISSCSVVNTDHFPRQEVYFFNNKKEKLISGGVDINSRTVGLNLNGSYAFSDHGYVAVGGSAYSAASRLALFQNLGPVDENREADDFTLYGTSLRIGAGMYRSKGSGVYLELGGVAEWSVNTLQARIQVWEKEGKVWKYHPLGIGVNFAIGKNKKNIGVVAASSLKYINYGEKLPFDYEEKTNYLEINKNILSNIYFSPAFCLRVGGGPVKILFNVGINVAMTGDVDYEPIANLGISAVYAFGRKIEK